MRLELGSFPVRDLVFGSRTEYRQGVLSVNTDELKAFLLKDSPFQDIEIDVARPGEKTRIVHALDVVEPRVKVSGPGCVFPGFLGPPAQVGEGRTHRLAGVAVIGAAEPFIGEEFWYAREAIIDMSGPGAEYTPFSRTVNLVLKFIPKPGDAEPDPDKRVQFVVDTRSKEAEVKTKATRLLCLKAAVYLAESVRDLTPDSIDEYQLNPVESGLPRVVYIQQNLAGSIYGSYIAGRNWVVVMHPNELMDGAMTSYAFWLGAHFRDATYLYQNNAIVEELYSRHGLDLDFRGILLFASFGYSLEEKEREVASVVKTARMLGADAAVLSPLSDGHPSVGHMMVCQRCEEAGIRTVIGAGEMTTALQDPGFTYWVPEADAMVVPGDYKQTVSLPPMDKVIGGSRVLNSNQDATGALEVEARQIYGSTNPTAATRVRGRLY